MAALRPLAPTFAKAGFFGTWLLISAFGLCLLWSYASDPGRPAQPPQRWPAESRMSAPAGEPRLLLFAHPRCPCTRATMGELDRLMARCQGDCSTTVLFYAPEGEPEDWTRTDLWAHAARIPGVTVLADPGGAEARLFGAVTSGQVLLYGADGALAFQGGITASRGHAGDNAGASAVAALVRGEPGGLPCTSVFGCPIDPPCAPLP